MYSPVVACLQCPICHAGLTEAEAGSGRALRCVNGHSFDIAKQGYANLGYPPPAYSGDTAGMVAARAEFQAAGHYRFIADAAASAAKLLCSKTQPELIVEAGAGTGYYLGIVLDALADCAGLALDVSKAALRRAAKAHPRVAAALCDVWRELPVADGAAGLLLSIFAPRNGAEFKRILASDGALVVVAPASSHLQELVGPLGLLSVGANKDEAVATSLGDSFLRVDEQRCDQLLHLTHKEVEALVQMGPSAWHVDPAALAVAIGALPEVVPVTASVNVSSFRVR
jgi:23S rRNA (guanine745-N1)-methyltransferase